MFTYILDSLLNIFLQPSIFGKNSVGQLQNVVCSISLPPEVDPNTVELGWLYEEDITDDNRVTIVTLRNYSDDSTIVTIIQFNPLAEEDEGEYICYAIINGSFMYESISFTCKFKAMS